MRIALTLLGCLLLSTAAVASTFLGPTPYLGFADSPFNAGAFSYFHLTDFENGNVASPGVIFTPGLTVLGPSPNTDSVDQDDGSIDGSGTAGHSLYSNLATTTMRFTFDVTALGQLPTHAGVVWTDVGNVLTGSLGIGNVSFEAFGPGGTSLGSIGPFTLGDGLFNGATSEDRFFGIVNAAGISAIEITTSNSTDWEVDHLQYGLEQSTTQVPEPATCALAALGLGAMLRRKRHLLTR